MKVLLRRQRFSQQSSRRFLSVQQKSEEPYPYFGNRNEPNPLDDPEFKDLWNRMYGDSSKQASSKTPNKKSSLPLEQTLVFLDFSLKSSNSNDNSNNDMNTVLGQVVISLFTNVVPQTCDNFLQLCTNTSEKKFCVRGDNIPLHYKNTRVHRVVPGFVIQTGDFQLHNGKGGESVFGPRFADENFTLKHDEPFLVGMANVGPNTNGSQFYFTLDKLPWLDGLNVVFGKVVKGKEVLSALEHLGTSSGRPKQSVYISNCGLVEDQRKRKEEEEVVAPVEEAHIVVEEEK